MKAVLQRVNEASVLVEKKEISKIDKGWLILLGICDTDSEKDILYLTKKIISLRAFCDESNKMNLNIRDVKGSILVVSQFTLYGSCNKGARPNFMDAAKPTIAKPLFDQFLEQMKKNEVPIKSGIFGAKMEVRMKGDGPVTLILESK